MPSPQIPAPGPLVDPVDRLSDDQTARAARQISLPGFGEEAQRRLAAARVLVIGAGGLGSATVPYLVGAGVGTIGVIDDDVVELSNLHRQIAHGVTDVGRDKTDSLAETARRLDPSVTIVPHRLRLTSSNALEVFADYDLVIDGSDNFPTRYLANDAAQLTGIPLIWGAILQYHGQVSVAWHRHGPGYRDLFPAPPAPEDVLSCGEGGVLPGLCGTIGSLLATEAMKLITGVGELLIGRVLTYDALAGRTRELEFQRDPDGIEVTELVDYELFCAGPDPVPESLSCAEFRALYGDDADDEARRSDDAMLLDVRSAEEHAGRRISGSRLLPLPEVEAADAAGTLEEFLGRVTGEVIVHCERDPRSIRAAKLLQAAGFDQVRYLRGGIRELATTAPELVKDESLKSKETVESVT